jgi:hypothetical protein
MDSARNQRNSPCRRQRVEVHSSHQHDVANSGSLGQSKPSVLQLLAGSYPVQPDPDDACMCSAL